MPYIKRLEVSQFNFLYFTEQAEGEMHRIEEDNGYRVTFGFIKKNHCLKIYCHEDYIDEIKTRLDDIFQRHQVYVEEVSYRVKGLAKI